MRSLPILYDDYFQAAQQILNEYNPCRFNDKGECWATREFGHKNCCEAYSCPHLTATGCSTENLACKFYLCSAIHLSGDASQKKAAKLLYALKNQCGDIACGGYFLSKQKLLASWRSRIKRNLSDVPPAIK